VGISPEYSSLVPSYYTLTIIGNFIHAFSAFNPFSADLYVQEFTVSLSALCNSQSQSGFVKQISVTDKFIDVLNYSGSPFGLCLPAQEFEFVNFFI
jgi:hypothetical protein